MDNHRLLVRRLLQNHIDLTYDGLVQEKDHLQLAVERVAAMHPDVLLVEKSVARSAQEALLRKGISLVLNVKPKLLERLARCTGAQVAPSVEHLNHACVAFCKEFAVDSLVRTCTTFAQASLML